jgi:imidazolonepropionase-like amidohydrolase
VLAPRGGDALLAGQGAAIMLDGSYDAVLEGSRSLFVSIGSSALPMAAGSRAGQYMLLDQAVRETRSAPVAGTPSLLLPAGREVLARYLKGGRVVFDVHRAADIRQVLLLARRYGMKPVIAGGAEAWLVAEDLAKAKVPVLLNPFENLPQDFDRLGARLDNAALLARAGVPISFIQSNDPSHNARKIRQGAGNAVAHGLPWNTALAALTAVPADIFGVAGRARIAPEFSADLVLWSADPLEVTTAAEQVWIAGAPVTMRSRQTELRDRYMDKLRRKAAR